MRNACPEASGGGAALIPGGKRYFSQTIFSPTELLLHQFT